MLYIIINVPNNKLEKILSSEKFLKRKYNEISKRLMLRINTLQTVDSLSEVPIDKPERCHLLDGNYEGCYAVCIDAKWRIIIKPKGYEMPYDKSLIKEIDILEITNYHN